MKILFYIHALNSGGAERVLVSLANNIVSRGDEVVISYDVERGQAFNLDDRIVQFDHRQGCFDTWSRKRFSIFRFIHTLHNMRKIEKQYKPDVVVSFITTFNIYTLVSLSFRNVPVIVSEHTTVTFNPPLRERITRDILYHHADAITVLTERDFQVWKNKFKNNLVCMPNPCESIEKNYKAINKKEKIVIAAGRVTSWKIKGFDNLIRCWSRLCHEFPDWKLQIAGLTDDKSLDYMNRIINEMNCCNVEFLGFRTDVYDLMRQSEVFALSSRREGLPMALIEAMSVGCCCVAFDVVTGPSEIIDNDKTGIIVENQNIDAFTGALRKVFSNDALRNRLAQSAPAGVQKYEINNVVDSWYDLFQKVTNNGK